MARSSFILSAALVGVASTLNAQWGPVQALSAPSPRSEALMAFDLFGNRMLLIGGNITDEMWAYAGGAWTQLNPTVRPPARRRGNLAANTFIGEVLLYGGQGQSGGTTALDDTWLWDGTAWQQQFPANTPGGLMWHGMAFDSIRQTYVVFGGRRNIFTFQYLDETWEYSVATNSWTQIASALSPPQLHRPAMCFHPTLNQTILFGGEDVGGNGTNETWLFDGIDWTLQQQTGPVPPPRTGAQLVPVINRGIVVLFGGRDPVTFDILNDTWEHDGTQWREVNNVYGGIYPPRIDAAIAHDIIEDRIVAFGGQIANQSLRNDTWEYGAHWRPFGMGCAGTAGVPTFTPTALPRLGSVVSAEIGNVPAGMPGAFVAVGVSRTQWALGTLPALLDPFGMPGCRTYTSADLFAFAPATAGVATWSWTVPNNQVFVGTDFHLQGVTFDPGANALGLAVSSAATMVVGN